MTTPPTNQIPEEPGTVILMEGERDRKPRPEALVNWPEARPPGGRLPESEGETVASSPERGQSPRKDTPQKQRFLIKVAGSGDLVEDLDEEPLAEGTLRWLADELNRERVPLMLNRPGVGSRGPDKKSSLDITMCAGFTARESAKFEEQGPDGAGVYAEVEALPHWASLIDSIIGTPGGIDITAHYRNSVISIDVVVRPRGTGKVIAAVETKSSTSPQG